MIKPDVTRMLKRGAAFSFTTLLVASGFGAEFMGAAKVIQETTALQPDAAPKEAEGVRLRRKLSEDAERFFANVSGMDPKAAAEEWVGLVKRHLDLPSPRGEHEHMLAQQSVTLKNLFQHLPAPSAWPEIQRQIESTTFSKPIHGHVLTCIAAKLNDDDAATSEALSKVMDLVSQREETYGSSYSSMLDGVAAELIDQEDTPASLAERFERLIELRAGAGDNSTTIQVPDLVSLVGEDTARQLLEKAIALKNTKFEFSGPNATQELAKSIALENISSLEKPRWDLVASLGSIELYEAMEQKFAPKEKSGSNAAGNLSWLSAFGVSSSDVNREDHESAESRRKADVYHYLDLLAAGRAAEAQQRFSYDSNFLSDLETAIEESINRIPKEVVYENLMQKAEAATTAPFFLWRTTQDLSEILNRQAHHTAAMEKLVATESVDNEARANLMRLLVSAYLQKGEVDKAIAVSRDTLALPEDKKTQSDKISAAHGLVRLGQVLERPELTSEGIQHLKNLHDAGLKGSSGDTSHYGYDSLNDKLVVALLAEDRGPEAEQVITDLLKVLGQQLKAETGSDFYRAQLLEKLVLVYAKEDRHSDIMALLLEAPWWNAADLTDVKFSVIAMDKNSRGKVAAGIARALAASGRKEEAVKLLKQFLINEPSNDHAYEVLVELTDESIIDWLNDLATRDRFEERPYIWKAVVLQKAGKLKEAGEAARQAMQIDPTDGEQPKGARLLAYAVLADILAASGNNTEAETLKKVVGSVRLAEHGDELNELGLASEAIKTYEEASRNFSDAYCVEWRLAKRLQEQGDEEGATLHYTKAFELMPNQFGRMVNLCFGCESIFAMEKPQSIAERVLQRMMDNPPVKATVYHLMGQLREEQGRFGDAAENYRRAVEIDPKYYDALKSLYDVAEKAFMSEEERSQLAFRLIELDPYMRHFSASYGVKVSPKVLWNVGERQRKWGEALSEPILALPASAARIEELKKKKNDRNGMYHQYHFMGGQTDWKGSGQYIAEQEWLQKLLNAMQYLD